MASININDFFSDKEGTVGDSKVEVSYREFLVDISKYLGYNTSSILTGSNINYGNRYFDPNCWDDFSQPYHFTYNLNIPSSSYTKTQIDINNFFNLYSSASYYTSYQIEGIYFPVIIQPQTSSKALNWYVFPYDTFGDQPDPAN